MFLKVILLPSLAALTVVAAAATGSSSFPLPAPFYDEGSVAGTDIGIAGLNNVSMMVCAAFDEALNITYQPYALQYLNGEQNTGNTTVKYFQDVLLFQWNSLDAAMDQYGSGSMCYLIDGSEYPLPLNPLVSLTSAPQNFYYYTPTAEQTVEEIFNDFEKQSSKKVLPVVPLLYYGIGLVEQEEMIFAMAKIGF